MPQRAITQPPFLRGLIASVDPYSQPRGSVPRGSNLLLSRRGSLDTCDGSRVLFEYGGAEQTNRGRIMASTLFSPVSVSPYYLVLAKALDLPLNAPTGLTVSAGGSGGTLATATYYYKVTALDGAGGETTASSEANTPITLGQKATLAWNTVPNASGYNIYRGISSGGELQLVGTDLPVSQPNAPLASTVSYVDAGQDSSPTVNVTKCQVTFFSAGQDTVAVYLATPLTLVAGQTIVIAGSGNPGFDGTFQVSTVGSTPAAIFTFVAALALPDRTEAAGGTCSTGSAPPAANNTQQTALFRLPTLVGQSAAVPVTYDNTDIVALFPADVRPLPGFGGGGGGSGGGGGTGAGGSGGTNTPSGGLVGTLSFIPQMVLFTNRVAIALGNGFAAQVYSDPTTATNPAQVLSVSSIAESGGDTATITLGSAPSVFVPVGSNIIVSGSPTAEFNGVFVVLGGTATTQSSPGTTLIVRNLVAAGTASGGTVTVTTVPLYNTFAPVFAAWAATVSFPVNSTVQPTTAPSNLYYFVAVQGGTTGTTEPTWPTALNSQVADGSVIWKNAGAVNSAAPAPPAAAHLTVYAGSLWAWNTWLTNTLPPSGVTGTGQLGLDGPTSLRMSDINNPFSWNPVNQAFLDKDDGTEGMGLQSFTVTAQGIPPEGSLVLCKDFSTFQVVGVFGAPNFAIQRVKSDMGCIAPRTLQFVPGYGLVRYTHLGFAVFDGVEDKVISEEIRPYLFPQDDVGFSDITVVDSNWVPIGWGAQTATPPMYACAMPIGNSGGALTRIFCYDLVLKAWTAPVDLPFSISTLGQFRAESQNAVTVMGGFQDGALQRWQAGDAQWYASASTAGFTADVAWNVHTPEFFADPSQRAYCRRVFLRFINTTATAGLTVTPYLDGTAQAAFVTPAFGTGDVELDIPVQAVALRFSLLIAGSGQVELDRVTWLATAKPPGVPRVFA
jgi:hypothetical protein